MGSADTNLAMFMQAFQVGSWPSFSGSSAAPQSAGLACCKAGLEQSGICAALQGSEVWRQHRTGDPMQDWLLLQQVARSDPEAFWHAALQQLRIKFRRGPDK